MLNYLKVMFLDIICIFLIKNKNIFIELLNKNSLKIQKNKFC